MRNKYPSICYHCDKNVEKGAGHFERHRGGGRAIHADCVFQLRKSKELITHA